MSTASARSSVPAAARFPRLGPLIGYLESLTSRADLRVLERMLGELSADRGDIEEACVFGTASYRRNTISRGTWHELVALCWRSGHCTPVHDHEGSSCAFRVIEGVGTEVRFERTACGLVCPVATNLMRPGYVCAAEDADIHQVANMQGPGQDLVTLHIYSPPLGKLNTYTVATSAGAEECPLPD
jgi:cysteine dioxygenase